jgi:hypothetical protein
MFTFIDRPRTLTVLSAMIVGLVYAAIYQEEDDEKSNTATNIKL